jgi:hypothetical protein
MVNPAPHHNKWKHTNLSARIQAGSLDDVLPQLLLMHAGSAEIITFLVNN